MPVIETPRGFKLGKNASAVPEGIEFKTFFEEAPPAPPEQVHYGHAVSVPWNMDGNGPDPKITIPGVPQNWTGAGDCVKAAHAHSVVTENYNEWGAGQLPDPTPDEVVLAYCAELGVTPEQLFDDPDQYDQGLDIPTSLNYWHTHEEYGEKNPFYATVDHTSEIDLKTGLWLTGGLQIGIDLRANNESQFPNTWTWDPSAEVLGGHSVWLTGFNSTLVWLVTWGQLIASTWENILNSISEAFAVGSAQAVAAGKGPTGLLIPKLQSVLATLAPAA